MKRHAWGLCAAAILATTASASGSEIYPTRTITLIMPYAAGGTTDVVGRMVANEMSTILGQPMVVENKPGANGVLATNYMKSQDADGYKLLFGSSGNLVIAPLMQSNAKYDAVRDFEPIGMVSSAVQALAVRSTLGVTDARQFLERLKANPGKLNFGSPGIGSTTHIAGEVLKKEANLDFVHVPFRSGSEVANALLAGSIDFTFDQIPLLKPLADAGKIRILAVAGQERHPVLSGIPTMKEAGFGDYVSVSWNGVFTQPKTPPEVVAKLSAALSKVVSNPEFRNTLTGRGLNVIPYGPSETRAFLEKEQAYWVKAIGSIGLAKTQ